MKMYKYSQKISFSPPEIRDLVKSLLVIGLAFAIVDYGFSFSVAFLTTVAISMLTAGMAFLLHELSHKVAAHSYGCWSEYRADNMMLFLTLLLSAFGWLFAAPGAVMINGSLTNKEYGKISAAGPLANILLSALFLALALLIPGGLIFSIAIIGASINAWIGLFNMIPFGNFDGIKIWRWNKVAYISMVVVSLGLMLLSSVIQ